MTALSVLRFDDKPDGSTSIVDDTGRVWTVEGDSAIDTSQKQYGSGSLKSTGDVDQSDLTTPVTPDIDPNLIGDWTIERWVRFSVLSGNVQFLWALQNPDGLGVSLYMTDDSYIYADVWGVGGVQLIPDSLLLAEPGDIDVDTWYHIALVHSGDDYYGFVHGVTTGPVNAPGTIIDGINLFVVGSGGGFPIWMDEFAFTDEARYTENFTPAPYPATEPTTVEINAPFVLTFVTEYDFPVVLSMAAINQIDAQIVLTMRSELDAAVVIDSPLPPTIDQDIIIDSPLSVSIEAAIVLSTPLDENNTIDGRIGISCSLLPAITTKQVSVLPSVTVNGRTIYLEAASVSFSDGQYAWTCALTLMNAADYDLFNANTVFYLDLEGETYMFIVDSKNVDRQDFIGIDATVNGISPLAYFDDPRHAPITRTWNTDEAATSIADELLENGPYSWEVLNWTVPANTLSSTSQPPVKVLQQLAKTAGGVLVSEPNGDVRIRYDYPISVPLFPVSAPDQSYVDLSDNFEIREEAVALKTYNSFRILNAESGNSGNTNDSIEFTQDPVNPTKGTLRVQLYPWRDVTVAHTSDNRVSVSPAGIKTETLTEWVEFTGGTGNTSRPVFTLGAVVWKFQNLGGVTSIPDTNQLTSADPVQKESLALITYTTRYLSYNVSAPLGYKVQFVMRDLPGVTIVTAAGIDIYAQRGGANRPGDDIIDQLIGSTAVALQRGRNELDAASGLQNVSATTVYRTGVRTGQLAEFEDSRTGTAWRGKVSSITHTYARAQAGHFELTTALSVQRQADFLGGASA